MELVISFTGKFFCKTSKITSRHTVFDGILFLDTIIKDQRSHSRELRRSSKPPPGEMGDNSVVDANASRFGSLGRGTRFSYWRANSSFLLA